MTVTLEKKLEEFSEQTEDNFDYIIKCTVIKNSKYWLITYFVFVSALYTSQTGTEAFLFGNWVIKHLYFIKAQSETSQAKIS